MPADGGQPKSTSVTVSRLDEFARQKLGEVLAASIAEGVEKGAVIYRDRLTQELQATQLRSGKDKDDHTVDVGHALPNCGCPPNAEPLAYYHTHPTPAGPVPGTRGLARVPEGFSDDDVWVADTYGLTAYVANRKGIMRRYVPKTQVAWYDGVRTMIQPTDAQGVAMPLGEGETVEFNWVVPGGRP